MNEIKRQLNTRIGDTSDRAKRVQRHVNLKINQPHGAKKVQWGYYAVIAAFVGILLFCINFIPSSFNVEIGNLAKPPHSTETNDTGIVPNEDHVIQDSPEYLAKNEGELSLQDSETAYEMCVMALTDYYKAVWNGSESDLDSIIENESLKRYTQMKIQYQSNLHSQSNNPVQSVEIGTHGVEWEVEYIDDANGGFLYLYLPAEIKHSVGSYGELTEFLVRNVNGKLVIVDWYSGGKDSYDFLVRGENETVDNPDIWNDRAWVEKLQNRQDEFSGSIR